MDAISEAVAAFKRHPLRAVLVLSVVMMAVAVTLTSAAVGAGARLEAQHQAARLGLNTVVLRDDRGRLTLEDASWLLRLRPHVLTATGVIRVNSDGYGVVGVTPAYAEIRDVALQAGRFIMPRDETEGARVAVIAADLARRMFGHRPAVGERFRLNRTWFVVIGVTSALASHDNEVFVPLSSVNPRISTVAPRQAVSEIWLRTSSQPRAKAEIANALRGRALSGVEMVVARDLLQARDQNERLFTRLTGATGALLFAIGAVAIANLLLTSVLERTTEIGLRRAVGATRRDIRRQFLFEAAIVSTAGSGAGLAAGAALSVAAARSTGWPISLADVSITVVPLAAIALGTAAGVYPAMKAASVQPIDAIMHE